MQTHSPLGNLLRKLRGEAGYSVREAALALEKSPGYLSRVEARGEMPSAELICEMAKLYGADEGELLEIAKLQQLKTLESQIEERHTRTLQLFRKKGS